MNNPVCAVCGHVNRAGVAACEACDARLYAAEEAAADFPGEPSGASGGPSWAASEPSGPGRAWPPAEETAAPAEEIPAPPFKGAGDVISPMLAVYRKHFTLVGLLVLVTTVPQALLQYGLMEAAQTGPVTVVADDVGAVAVGVISGLLFWLLSTAAGALLSGALVYAVVDLQRAGSASAVDCLARGMRALPKVFLVTLLYGVIVGVGYVLLIVPGIIASLMLAVCVPAAVVEGRGPVDALKRSKELTEGYRGLIFFTYFLWGLLIMALTWVVQWSFISAEMFGLPSLILQMTVLGMFNSTVHVLTVYVYLGLLRERRSGFNMNTFTP